MEDRGCFWPGGTPYDRLQPATSGHLVSTKAEAIQPQRKPFIIFHAPSRLVSVHCSCLVNEPSDLYLPPDWHQLGRGNSM